MFRFLQQGLFKVISRPVPRLSANAPHSVDSAAGSNLKFWLDLLAKERLETSKEVEEVRKEMEREKRQEVEEVRKEVENERRQEVEEACKETKRAWDWMRKETKGAWDLTVDYGAEIVQLKV